MLKYKRNIKKELLQVFPPRTKGEMKEVGEAGAAPEPDSAATKATEEGTIPSTHVSLLPQTGTNSSSAKREQTGTGALPI